MSQHPIEVMKQALEALEAAARTRRPELIKQAITALRTAIEAAEKQEPAADELIRSYIGAVVADKPDEAADATKRMVDYVFATPPAAQQGMTIDASAPLVMTPHPAFAKRQWVGLTEAEVDRCWNMTPMDTRNSRHMFAYSIEAKLKEKNT